MFSGIEGFGLGFELAGWPVETAWQSEIDPFCLQLLARRYPDAQQLGNIRDVADAEIPACEVLTAGFPCQPVSQAGKGLAQDDPRWLWPEVARVIGTVHPRLVICENVRGLRSRGLSIVLGDLARLGYDAQWDLLPAAAVGAPHLRHRFWIVAYPADQPLGRVFKRKPPVFPWAPEEPAKPRLVRESHRRRERLTSLGNGVVPHAVAGVALNISVAGQEWGEDAWMVGESNAVALEAWGTRPPTSGALIGGRFFSLPTSAPRIKKTRLWPTATANEGEWSLEAIMRCVDKDGNPARDPHVRHYNPDTGQIVQRTLTNYVKGVEAGLWPTPVASDSFGSRRRTARTDRWQSNDGVTLLDAVWIEEGVDASEVFGRLGAEGELLYPTPLAADGDRTSRQGRRHYATGEDNPTLIGVAGREDEREELWPTASATDYKVVSAPGQRRGQLEEAVKLEERLWPTPGAQDGSGKGAAPNRGVVAPGVWRQVNLVDAVVEHERELWPTPNAADGAGGRTTAGNREGGPPLAAAVHEAENLWLTPTAAPWSHGGAGGELDAQVQREEGIEPGPWSRRDGEQRAVSAGSLNPRWVEWLMGYPPGWTIIEFVPGL